MRYTATKTRFHHGAASRALLALIGLLLCSGAAFAAAPMTTQVPSTLFAPIAANSIFANFGASQAVPSVVTLTDCSGKNQALNFTAGTGLGCVTISGGGGGSPGGSNTDVQFNSSGSFGGDAGFTYGSGAATLGIAGSEVGSLSFANATSGSTTLVPTAAAGTTTATLPANTGTLAELNLAQIWSATQTFPNNSITNAELANDTISGISLGSNLDTLTFGTHLSAGGSSYNGSAAVTISSDATNADTVSTIVARDASGNFSAGTITAALTGHASLDLEISNNLSDLNSASTARTNLGLGTAATQNTGTSGATVGLLNGNNTYSGSDTFSGTFNCSGTCELSGTAFGTMATQSAGSVAITGGAINGAVIGGTTPAAGSFTSLGATGSVTFSGLATTGTIGGSLCQTAPGVVLYISGANCFTSSASIVMPQTVSGTNPSGGLVYGSSATQIATSAAGTAGDFVTWGGAGTAPEDSAAGAGVLTVLSLAPTGTGAMVAQSSPTINTPVMTGITSGAAAATGDVGESGEVTPAAVSLANGTPKSVASVTLTAGVWNIWGTYVTIPSSSTTQSYSAAGLSTTNNSFSGVEDGSSYTVMPYAVAAGIGVQVPIGFTQVNITSSTTYYLVGQTNFATSTLTATGIIEYQRVR